ncbi:phosphatase PAP2 family protein [Streptococcus sp. H31]|uniref:phosphatase PAP2 family protein n=1 Tax=Streptococcus huangxiaojuni TaxID=3237239 RepID=UPI0034A51C46
MKNKQTYLMLASFALLLFMALGYLVRFYPETLAELDAAVQTGLRGDLPHFLTVYFKTVTVVGNPSILIAGTVLCALFFALVKKWRTEACFLAGNLLLILIFSTAFKYLYQRPRPDLLYLIEKPMGPSFPSWHAASTCLILGALMIIAAQRLKNTWLKYGLELFLALLLISVGLSRIYLGVHYPSDIVGGWLLAAALLAFLYPFYEQRRFIWRFQSKQR